MMSTDALAPGVARSSVAMILTGWYEDALVITDNEFHQLVMFQRRGMTKCICMSIFLI